MITGIQPSGNLHLGNYFGAIRPSDSPGAVVFIADYHALTTASDPHELRENIQKAVAAVRACLPSALVFRQSQFPEVQELAGILGNVTPTGLLLRAVSYKDKVEKGIPTNLGLLSYPVLMTADILAFGGSQPVVPVGPDQVQHLNMSGDIVRAFNARYVANLPIPKGVVSGVVVPGTDGQKMSKSYGNTIPLMTTDRGYGNAIAKIVTDSTPLEAPKDPENRIPYKLYSLLATTEEREEMAFKFRQGGYGDGHAKAELQRKMIEVFGPMRTRYETFLREPCPRAPDYLRDQVLDVVADVRAAVGL